MYHTELSLNRANANPAANQHTDKSPTSLEISIGEMDNLCSRFFNTLNKMDTLVQRLKLEPPTPMKPESPASAHAIPPDHCGKLEHQNGVFNDLNNRLEAIVVYLQRVI